MANRQLVDYIREQLTHKMDINQLRTILLKEGWAQPDIEAAISEVYAAAPSRAHKEHHTHYVALAVSGIVVVVLAVALFIIVFKGSNQPVIPEPTTPVPERGVQELTGWAVCQQEMDSEAKNACYERLNAEEDYDCSKITNGIERNFCLRAKETIILQTYAAGGA